MANFLRSRAHIANFFQEFFFNLSNLPSLCLSLYKGEDFGWRHEWQRGGVEEGKGNLIKLDYRLRTMMVMAMVMILWSGPKVD